MKWQSWICGCSNYKPLQKIPTNSEGKQDRQSQALNNARAVFQLISNLGSGGVNVPGLQAAGQIGIQIIDLVKKIKSNRSDLEELVERIADLLDPVQKALGTQNKDDISAGLKDDLVRFKRDMEEIRDTLEVQVKRNAMGRTVNADDDAADIMKCKTRVDQGYQRFQASSMYDVSY